MNIAFPQLSGERDKYQQITSQLEAAQLGYTALCGVLDKVCRIERPDAPLFDSTVEMEFESWFDDEKKTDVDYIYARYPEVKFSLVAVPNVIVSAENILKLGEHFDKALQSHKRYGLDNFYREYTAEELSGTKPGNGRDMQLSLFPNQNVIDILKNVCQSQRTSLRQRQLTHPHLKVPSVFESLAYRYLNARTETEPYIRHFNLRSRPVGNVWHVPVTALKDNTTPLTYSRSNNRLEPYIKIG